MERNVTKGPWSKNSYGIEKGFGEGRSWGCWAAKGSPGLAGKGCKWVGSSLPVVGQLSCVFGSQILNVKGEHFLSSILNSTNIYQDHIDNQFKRVLKSLCTMDKSHAKIFLAAYCWPSDDKCIPYAHSKGYGIIHPNSLDLTIAAMAEGEQSWFCSAHLSSSWPHAPRTGDTEVISMIKIILFIILVMSHALVPWAIWAYDPYLCYGLTLLGSDCSMAQHLLGGGPPQTPLMYQVQCLIPIQLYNCLVDFGSLAQSQLFSKS